MKDFFKMMFASMLGFFITSIILFFVFLIIIFSIVSSSTSEDVVIHSKSILHIELDKPILDRSPKNPIFFDLATMSRKTGLSDILKNITKAKDDKNISGIFLDISFIDAGISTVSEIRNALIDFKKSGKFIYCYSEDYSQAAYYLATASDRIFLHPQGMLLFKGINAEMVFLKGLLEKLDVKVQVVRHGKFKAATEPFFLDKMSPENRQQVTALISNTWSQIVKGISETRNISEGSLNKLADSLKIKTPEDALRYKLIDQIAYKDEILMELRKKINIPGKDKINFITIEKYTNVPENKKERSGLSDKIAVVYAYGNIVGSDAMDDNIGSEEMSKAIRKAREDEDVKAIVLRVNSPGGSALASDVIWREVNLAAKVKPVVASLGDVAASGGYYIVCPSTRILADPMTITGSIGVFGLVPNMKGLFNNKLGITFDNAKTNLNSDYIPVTEPLSPYQSKVLQDEIERIYSTFISHVAEGRHLKKDIVDSIGQGRVWNAMDAKKIGLIDDFGGLEKAVETAAALANIKDYRILDLPEQKDLIGQIFDELLGSSRVSYLEKELGENYRYYLYLKQVREMKGIQARLPFELILN
jgi:protease IV